MPRKLRKALLVYPKIPSNTYWSFKYALNLIRRKSAMPPLGLITIAALFPKSIELKLIDMNVEPLKEKDVAEADAVFISAMAVQKKSFAEIVQLCKRLNKPVVAGGPYITVSHSEISDVDHFLLGEVEDTFQNFLQEFENGTAKKIYPITGRPDMAKAVSPRFDLLKLKVYSSMSIQYSRGCPFNCEFCDVWQIYGRKPRIKSSENILAELDILYRLKWRGAVFVVDDNFIGNKAKVKSELLPVLIKWHKAHNYIFRFYTEASLNLADDEELLAGMRDAGFNSVFLGIETPSEDSLKETGKLQNLKTNMPAAIAKIQSYGMEVMGGFIIGFDSDSETIFHKQVDFIQKTAIPKAMIGLLNAIPGTQLYKRLKKENRILSDDLSGSNTHDLKTNFMTKMNPKVLIDGYKKVLNTLYDKNLKNYFKRCNQFLDRVGQTPFFQRDVHWDEIHMLLKSLRVQSFTRYGYQYLKFLTRNFIKHNKTFAEAVRMSIEGHHLYKITREMLKVDKLSSLLEVRYRFMADKIHQWDTPNKKIKELARLWKIKKRSFRQLRRKIQHVNADFREDLIQKYNEMDKRIQAIFAKYRSELIQYNPRLALEI